MGDCSKLTPFPADGPLDGADRFEDPGVFHLQVVQPASGRRFLRLGFPGDPRQEANEDELRPDRSVDLPGLQVERFEPMVDGRPLDRDRGGFVERRDQATPPSP